MRLRALSSNLVSTQALAPAPHESNEQRRARLQALLTELLDVRRIATTELAQTRRVVADCEAAVIRLSAALRGLAGEPDADNAR